MEMSLLDDRLRTRFEGGLMADIQPPDLETRMAITRSKAAQLGMILPNHVVEYIATNLTSNVRQLEGVIKRLTAYRKISNEEISTSSVDWAIADLKRVGISIPTPEIIIRETARYYSLKGEDLRGQNRSKNTAMARQVSMYLMRKLTNLSLKDIGAPEYEDRNHATVLASIRKVEDLMKTDPDMGRTIRDITLQYQFLISHIFFFFCGKLAPVPLLKIFCPFRVENLSSFVNSFINRKNACFSRLSRSFPQKKWGKSSITIIKKY